MPQLVPDLACAVDLHVGLPNASNLSPQILVALAAYTAQFWKLLAGGVTQIRRGGNLPAPCRSARPCRRPGGGRYRHLLLELAVERRLGEKSTGRLQNLAGPAQFLDLAFQSLHALAFAGGYVVMHAAVDLAALDPVQQRGRNATDLRRNGLDGRPQRWMLATMLLRQAHGALAHFREKLILLTHNDSIFSKSRASAKSEAIHGDGEKFSSRHVWRKY